MNFGDYLWTLLVIFFMVTYFMIFLRVLTDLFRDHETSGLAKTAWVLFLFVVPFFGLFIYLLVRGRGMTDRAISAQRQRSKPMRSTSGASSPKPLPEAPAPAPRSARPASCWARGTVTQAEFDAIKTKALA